MAGGGTTDLEIVISAVDQASEAFQSVADTLQALADEAGSSTEEVSAALQSVGLAVDASTGDITNALQTQQQSFDSLAEVAKTDVDEIQQLILDEGISFQQAQSVIEEANQAIADSTTTTADTIKGAAGGFQMGELMMAGTVLAGAGGALTAPAIGSIQAAADKTQALAQGLNSISNIINANKGGNQQNATQIADITAKIDNYKASIAQANASMQQNIGMTAVVEARHQKAAAAIQQANINIAKQEALLQPLINKQQLGAQSAQAISSQFETLANNATALGVPFDTAYNALIGFLNLTGSTKDANAALNDAIGLWVSGKVKDLPSAINDIQMAWRGFGRSLQNVVPDIQDGVAGMDALNQIHAAVQGSPAVAFQQLNTQIAALQTNLQQLGAAVGNELIGPLTKFVETLNSVIEKMTKWAQEHPKLAAAILIVLGILGAFLVVVGTLMTTFGLLGMAIFGMTAIIPFIGVSFLALVPIIAMWGGIILGLVIIVASVVALIIQHWSQIKAFFETAGKDIEDFFKAHWQLLLAIVTGGTSLIFTEIVTHWTDIEDFFKSSGKLIETIWHDTWTGISTFLNDIWNAITNTVKTGVNDLITIINGLIGALDGLHISIPAIKVPGTNVGTPALNLGFNIPKIPMLAAGGVVYDPVLAMIGEQGPEAVVPLSQFAGAGGGFGGGGSPIVININGGIFPADASTIKQIGDMLARSVLTSLRVRNYQP